MRPHDEPDQQGEHCLRQRRLTVASLDERGEETSRASTSQIDDAVVTSKPSSRPNSEAEQRDAVKIRPLSAHFGAKFRTKPRVGQGRPPKPTS